MLVKATGLRRRQNTMSEILVERFAPSPIGLLRSSLFAAAERASGHVQGEALITSPHYTLKYSGPRLTQRHALIWQTLILEHRIRCGHRAELPLRIRQSDLLRALGQDGKKDTSTAARNQLRNKLRDLEQAEIELVTPKHSYCGHLVGEVLKDQTTGALEISFPWNLSVLLSDELAFIDLDRKLSLGRNQLACWLHDFISTQCNNNGRYSPFPFAVRDLHRLSGTTLALPQFRPRLHKAVVLLMTGDRPLLLSARINTADQLVYDKTNTRVLLKKAEANVVVEARYRHLDAVEAALERRGRVAL
jgi:hypothetical protein